MSERDNHSTNRSRYAALGMTIGLVFGGIIGIFADNIALFAGGGLVLGLALGSAWGSRS